MAGVRFRGGGASGLAVAVRAGARAGGGGGGARRGVASRRRLRKVVAETREARRAARDALALQREVERLHGLLREAGVDAGKRSTVINIAFVESQNGNLSRYNRRTGERKSIRPRPARGEDAYRFNWSAPIQLSPFDPATVYFADNHVFKSTDRADSWEVLGKDLTREIDRDSLPMMGSIPARNAVSRHQGTAVFSNISTMHVSSLRPGLIATGTDDGTISVTTDDGQIWRKMTDFPGVPDTTYVSRVALVRPRRGDALRDPGWPSQQRLPPLRAEEHRHGRELDVHRGRPAGFRQRTRLRRASRGSEPALRWHRGAAVRVAERRRVVGSPGERFPPSPVHDLKIHPRDDALVVATHGRGFS